MASNNNITLDSIPLLLTGDLEFRQANSLINTADDSESCLLPVDPTILLIINGAHSSDLLIINGMHICCIIFGKSIALNHLMPSIVLYSTLKSPFSAVRVVIVIDAIKKCSIF